MAVLVCDPKDEARLIGERKRLGLDRYDEVWDGVYVMSPLAGNEHQHIGTHLSAAMLDFLPRDYKVLHGANVSDRIENWAQNYRIPDVLVFLPGNAAQDCSSHWYGGPDWAAEILSPGDRARQKFDFYAKVGVRELLIVDRDPWALELYTLKRKKLKLVGKSTPDGQTPLASTLFPLTFRLVPGDPRPLIEVTTAGGKSPRRF